MTTAAAGRGPRVLQAMVLGGTAVLCVAALLWRALEDVAGAALFFAPFLLLSLELTKRVEAGRLSYSRAMVVRAGAAVAIWLVTVVVSKIF